MRRKNSRIILCVVLTIALVASLAMPLSASAATAWTAPTAPMTVDNSIVKVGAHAAATTAVHYLGANLVTQRSTDFNSENNAKTSAAAFTAAEADTKLGIWGSAVNAAPDPYEWNLFYNYYAAANGKAVSEDAQYLITIGGPASTDGTLSPAFSGESATLYRRPEVIYGFDTTTPNGYQAQIAAIKAANRLPGDATYNPAIVQTLNTNIYEMSQTMYDLANAIKASGKSGRYGDPVAIAARYEKYLKGVQLYILSKQADGVAKKKTVAIIDPALKDNGKYSLYNTSQGMGTAATIRAAEYLAYTTNNVIDTKKIANEGSAASGAAFYITPQDLVTVDVIIANGTQAAEKSEEAIKADLIAKGVKESDIPPILATVPNTTFGIKMNSVENIFGIPDFNGFVYPEIINPIYGSMYLIENFWHVKSRDSVNSIAQSIFQDASLSISDAQKNPAGYKAATVEAWLNTGLQYYANNKAAIDKTYPNLKLTSGVKAPAKLTAPKTPAKPAVTAAKKAAKITIKKISGATSYQVRYQLKGSKTWKTKTVKSTAKSATIKKLKSGKTYKIQIRAIKAKNGVTVNGKWSKAKSIKVK